MRYQALDIEQQWYDSINEIADRTAEWKKGCAKLRQYKEEIMQWLNAVSERTKWAANVDRSLKEEKTEVFLPSSLSQHHYEVKCGHGKRSKVVQSPLLDF